MRTKTTSQQQRIVRNAKADYCKILKEHSEAYDINGAPERTIYTVQCESDAQVIVVNQASTGPNLVTKRRVVPQVIVQEGGHTPCCVLELLPLVAAAAFKVDVDGCLQYHRLKLGCSFTSPNTKRGFAQRVLSKMTVQFVTSRDVRLCLDAMFDRPGAVWDVAQWYAERTNEKAFEKG